MPIHDVGYRRWEGTKTQNHWRWWMITLTGIRLALKSKWIGRMLLAAWLPVMYWGVGFFVVEKAIETNFATVTEETSPLNEMERLARRELLAERLEESLEMISDSGAVVSAIQSDDPEVIRRDIWRWLLMMFFRYPQSFLIVFLVGSVAPALISRDIRSRAFLLYFSKPIGRFDYLLGKMMVPAAYIAAVTTLPALALFVFAVLMSPDFTVLFATWDIPFRILACTAVLVIPTASLALMLSALTQESRFSTFAWFAVWVLGHGAYVAVVIATAIRMRAEPFSPEVMSSTAVEAGSSLSLYNCLGSVQSWIFGFKPWGDVWLPATVLAALTLFSWFMLYRRVSSPIRV